MSFIFQFKWLKRSSLYKCKAAAQKQTPLTAVKPVYWLESKSVTLKFVGFF